MVEKVRLTVGWTQVNCKSTGQCSWPLLLISRYGLNVVLCLPYNYDLMLLTLTFVVLHVTSLMLFTLADENLCAAAHYARKNIPTDRDFIEHIQKPKKMNHQSHQHSTTTTIL
jgi:hypothetical protein